MRKSAKKLWMGLGIAAAAAAASALPLVAGRKVSIKREAETAAKTVKQEVKKAERKTLSKVRKATGGRKKEGASRSERKVHRTNPS
ncbi:MAG: hypothetical protein ACM3Q4_13295 [Acidobacteriota bacterium]